MSTGGPSHPHGPEAKPPGPEPHSEDAPGATAQAPPPDRSRPPARGTAPPTATAGLGGLAHRHGARRALDRLTVRHPAPTRFAHAVAAVFRRYLDEDAGTLAAGIALFSIAALPALIIAAVALYGLVASPREVWDHVDWLARFLPADVTEFLRGQMDRAAQTTSGTLSLTVAIGVGLALIGSENAVSSAMSALNRIFGLPEHRGFVRRHALALALSLAAFAVALVGLAALVALPAVATWLGWHDPRWDTLRLVRWPVAFATLTAASATFYRLAPCEARTAWRHAALGGAIAASLWLAASAALSWYATRIVDYQRLYGAAGGVVVVLVWFYLGAAAILLGGLASAEAGRHAGR